MRTTNKNLIEQLCFGLASLALICVVALTVNGCGKGGGNNGGGGDMATGPGGGGDMTPPCSTNPQTHLEIINACTSSQSFDVEPFFPANAPNGTLPSLP
jgi:hypothetical protein